MTPHDELMAIAGKAAAIAAKLPTLDTLEAVDDDASSGQRPCQITLTISEVRDLRALLDSDAFRAMVRNDARYRRLRENCRPWGVCSDEPHALIRICRGEFQGGIGWFNSIGPASRVGIIDLDTAVDAAFGEAIDAAASGAGEG